MDRLPTPTTEAVRFPAGESARAVPTLAAPRDHSRSPAGRDLLGTLSGAVRPLPVDLVGAVLVATLGFVAAFADGPPLARVLFGLPLVLFLPGYAIVSALFPAAGVLDGITRVALGFGLSLAFVPLLGLVLDRSAWGITDRSTPAATLAVIVAASTVAVHRRAHLRDQQPFSLRLAAPPLPPPRLWDPATRTIVALVFVGTGLLLVGATPVVLARVSGDPLTEFALYNDAGDPEFYPRRLTVGEPAEVRLGVVNAEGEAVRFRIEVGGPARLVEPLPPIDLANDEAWTGPARFALTRAGADLPVQFHLFRLDHAAAAAPHRSLVLWVEGLEPGSAETPQSRP